MEEMLDVYYDYSDEELVEKVRDTLNELYRRNLESPEKLSVISDLLNNLEVL